MKAQSGRTGKAGSVRRLTSEKAMGKVSKKVAKRLADSNKPKKRSR